MAPSHTSGARSRRSINFTVSAPSTAGMASTDEDLLNMASPSAIPSAPYHPRHGCAARKRCNPRHSAAVTNMAESVSLVV